MIEEVNTPDWDKKLAEKVVLIDFWAPWCQPCKVQEPILEELVQELLGLSILKLNIDDNRYLSQKLGVRNIPTLVLYDNGIEVKRFVGIQTKEILKSSIKL
ncbi:MAG: thioredoxin [Bacteroidetes bacterium]|nr:MAG: thioredoxin [Bacteroidota bacterium]